MSKKPKTEQPIKPINELRSLKDIINTEAKEYAIYTVENRAMPCIMDGLKPVQRFVLYEALRKNAKDFVKLASVASGVSDAGYHHGENSAQEAGKLMASTWNNNFPILKGRGNFGSRLIQQGAAARYVYCKVSEEFDKVFLDHDVAPTHPDEEHKPPRFYLPIIPTVLLNGVRGIATGFSTNIHPYSLKSVIECTKLAVQGKLDKNPIVKFPDFHGNIEVVDDNSINILGTYEFVSATKMVITEVPIKYDREKYIEILDKLVSENKISYTDSCGAHGFRFDVTIRKEFGLKKDEDARHNQIMSTFKLIQPSTEYIVVIDENGNLRTRDYFKDAKSVIGYFVGVRMKYIDKRIENNIKKCEDALKLANAKYLFITKVIANEIEFKNHKKSSVKEQIKKYDELSSYTDTLMNMPLYNMTEDELERLSKYVKSAQKDLDYWKSTTATKEYLKDLKELESIVNE